jgi:hypothetical protein
VETTSRLAEVDPFDLPEWLGTGAVTWESLAGLRTGHQVQGELRGGAEEERLRCDLLAVDEAYPAPVVEEVSRSRAHQAWQYGQVLVAELDGLLVLGVPGTRFDADRVLDALDRLARAVGASPDHFAARIRIGSEEPRRAVR